VQICFARACFWRLPWRFQTARTAPRPRWSAFKRDRVGMMIRHLKSPLGEIKAPAFWRWVGVSPTAAWQDRSYRSRTGPIFPPGVGDWKLIEVGRPARIAYKVAAIAVYSRLKGGKTAAERCCSCLIICGKITGITGRRRTLCPTTSKRPRLAGTQDEADAKTRATVQASSPMSVRAATRRVRELSGALPTTGRRRASVSPPPKSATSSPTVSPKTIDDIKFAPASDSAISAAIQRAALKDVESRTLPGVVLGHRHTRSARSAAMCRGGRYPMVASAHMSIVTAKVAGVDHITACTAPTRAAAPRDDRGECISAAPTRLRVLGGVQAVARDGRRTASFSAVDSWSARATPIRRTETPALRQGSAFDLFAGRPRC